MNEDQNLVAHHPRSAVRQKSFLRAMIHLKDARTAFDCMIRDLSPKGARLDFAGAVPTPDVFDLYISQKQQVLRANVMWRHGDKAGVAFAHTTPTVEPAKANELSQRVSRIEGEIAAFKSACKRLQASMKPLEL
jgi:hypothetical protein